MKFIIRLHAEITIKSKAVRKRFTRLLEANTRSIMKLHGVSADVRSHWDKLVMSVHPDHRDRRDEIIGLLTSIPGIAHILWVEETPYTDMDDILAQVQAHWREKLVGKSFVVRCKRRGKHGFTSSEVERYVGGGLHQLCETGGVDLHNPDVTVSFEVENDRLLQIRRRIEGLGGMPLPTQEDVVSLISGGFDSTVASFNMIKRGCRTHFCFFNLGGREHEIAVKQVCYYLWRTYSLSHRVKFIAVDFEPVVADILENVDNGVMGVVLKRCMMRAAALVAESLDIDALVTGESMGQVSSQTITNLHVIDQSVNKLILRPLITMDKGEIIDVARKIGAEDLVKSIPEYCGVISVKPNIRAQLDKVLEEEMKLDSQLLERVVRQSDVRDIRSIARETEREVGEVESIKTLPADAIVVDIRAPEEEENNPLELDDIQVLHIPFYRLATQFESLDMAHTYYLYCDRGVMSRLQTLLLHEQGYPNVKMYRP